MSLVDEPPTIPFASGGTYGNGPKREATIVSVTPSGHTYVGGAKYYYGDEHYTSGGRQVRTYALVYRYEMRLWNLTITEKRGVGFMQHCKAEVRRDIERRRYSEDPLDAVRGLLPVTFEV